MGEYFLWTNPSKKQYISEHDEHDCAFMFGVASQQGCELTDDACALMAGPWRGDAVAYIGDYFPYLERSDQRFVDAFGEFPWEIAVEEYEELRPDPAGTPHYRFAINETRGEFIDRDGGPIAAVLEPEPGRYEWMRYDPTAALFSPSYGTGDPVRGRWCFDDVRMSHERPGSGYEDVSGCFAGGDVCVMATDVEMRALVESDVFERALRQEHPELRGAELVGGVGIAARLLEIRRT